LRELIRRAENIDADAIIGVDYEIDGVVSLEAAGVRLERSGERSRHARWRAP
jgi:hypothetical protein